jgi:hypothetical protein
MLLSIQRSRLHLPINESSLDLRIHELETLEQCESLLQYNLKRFSIVKFMFGKVYKINITIYLLEATCLCLPRVLYNSP